MKLLLHKFLVLLFLLTALDLHSQKLVILHTNDSHSQIDPADNGQGGILRRKALIDSIKSQNPYVMLVDAGDAVQGTMYFTIYKGEVEYGMLDSLGYDFAVLGNHDFDNGAEALAQNLSKSKTTWLTANYDLNGAPGLDSVFEPYSIKEYGDKKIGVFGINLVPEGMIAAGNYNGVVYQDAYERATETAHLLRNKHKADYVIAVTHIGYDGSVEPSDRKLAAHTHGIDLIVGGHSHTVLDPEKQTERYYWKHVNSKGDTVAVVQAGSRGAYLGEVVLDLKTGEMDYQLLPIDSRYDDRIDPELNAVIEGYRSAVDSIMLIPVGRTARALTKNDAGLSNFLGEFVAQRGRDLTGLKVDMSILNAGGIRRELPEGEITKGMIIDMMPFNNRVVVVDIKGSDLLEAIQNVIGRGGFDGIGDGVTIIYNPENGMPVQIDLNGKTIEPEKHYILSTIDYLYNGGDYMSMLPRAKEIARSKNVLNEDLVDYITSKWKGRLIDGDPVRRVRAAK